MTDEVTIIVQIKAKPEFRDQVKAKLQQLTLLTNQEEGNICYLLHQVKDDLDQFVIYETWQNQQALDFHMNQDYLKNFLLESENLLAAEIHGTVCHQIS